MSQKFFQIVPYGTKIDFIGKAPFLAGLSGILLLIAVFSLFTRGLNYGVDFTGGTEVHVRFQKAHTAAELREALKPVGYSGAVVQEIGDEKEGTEFLIHVGSRDVDLKPYEEKLQSAFDRVAPAGDTKSRIRFSEDRLYVRFPAALEPAKIQKAVNDLQLEDIRADKVTLFGKASNHEYLVQVQSAAIRIIGAFEDSFGKGKFEILQIEEVGPRVGKELRMQAVGAVLISILFLLIYIWFRFEFEFAPGAILALVHDSVLVLGVFSVFQLRFDLSIVAAVLTIVGYSINDTIVLYDRVRENVKLSKDPNLSAVINDSINQTLARTILTSGTVLFASVALLWLGGPITFNFALAFTIGILVGTYSSVCIASPVTIYLRHVVQKKRFSV